MSFEQYPRRRPPQPPEGDEDDTPRNVLGMSFRDRNQADARFTDAVLQLYAESPSALMEAQQHYGVPSSAVHEVLRRYGKRW